MGYKLLSFLFIFIFGIQLSRAQMDTTVRRPKLGLVLSGGGSKGFAHIGVLKVLDRHGIKVDYIAGASMGAILGSLYAIGYSGNSLDSLISGQNWEKLIKDEISRRDMSVVEKENEGKSFLSLPMQGLKIQIPSGFKPGQNISKMLDRLTLPVHNISDFSKFDIPFLCTAANIETGVAEAFTTGYLPEVLRASMAIPSVFTPVNINGQLYVDGGLINNLPVDELKKRGVDIVIAVDVQGLYVKQDQLNSALDIFEQSSRFLRAPSNSANRKLADVLIRPDLEGKSMFAFSEAQYTEEMGERAAEAAMPAIMAKLSKHHLVPPDSLMNRRPKKQVNKITVGLLDVGTLKNVTYRMTYGRLNLKLGHPYTPTEIEKSIDALYGTMFFDHVTYRYVDTAGLAVLNVYPHEKQRNEMKIGLHYDDYLRAGIYVNLIYRNLFKKASILSIDTRISDNFQASIQYFLENGHWLSHYIRLESNSFKTYSYENGVKMASFQYSDLTAHLGFQSTLSNNIAWGLGLYGEVTSVRNTVNPISLTNLSDRLFGAYFVLKVDNFDRTYFPTRGIQMQLDAKILTDYNSKATSLDEAKPIFAANFRYHNAIPITKRFTSIYRMFASATYCDSIPVTYNCFIGGMSRTNIKGILPFAGLEMMEKYGRFGWVGRLDLQYEWTRNHFISLIANTGMVTDRFNDFYHYRDFLLGGGIAYGYKSLIGPIELTLTMTQGRKPSSFFNIGLWF